jgi:MFS family permease
MPTSNSQYEVIEFMFSPKTASSGSPSEPWLVCLSAALFFFFVFIQMNMFNAVGSHLMQTFHLSAAELGHLSASYFYANVIFLYPAGLLLDRLSPRRIILFVMMGAIACTFWFAMANSYNQILIARFLTGAFGAFCLLSSVKVASRWFPPKRMALIIGLIVTLAMIGGMISQSPLTYLTDTLGWRQTILIDGIFGILLLVPMVVFIKDFPLGASMATERHAANHLGFWEAIGKTVLNPQNWLAGLYVSLINLPLMILGTTWGALFLTQAHHLSRPEASFMITILFFGMIIGSTSIGWISDYIGKRKPPMIFGAIACLFISLLLIYLPDPGMWTLKFLFFLLGYVSSFQIIGYPLIAESNPPELTGSAEGLSSILIMSGGFTVSLFPYFLNLNWDNQIINNVPIYSLYDYRMALLLLPAAFLIALVSAILVRETNATQSVKKKVEMSIEPN